MTPSDPGEHLACLSFQKDSSIIQTKKKLQLSTVEKKGNPSTKDLHIDSTSVVKECHRQLDPRRRSPAALLLHP